jgi:hypothetical protein
VARDLVIELGEGFDADDVAIIADGREAWHQQDVRTNYSVGLAEVVTLSHVGEVEVVIRRARRTRRMSIPPALGDRVRVSFDPDGDLQIGPAPAGPLF